MNIMDYDINYEHHIVTANTIADAWRAAIRLTVSKGYDFVVKGGSYMGQIRKQLPYFYVIIRNPGTRPLAPQMDGGRIPPTSEEKIEAYKNRYLATAVKAENEVYTYGEFIAPQLPQIIKLLIESKGNTNQACIAIGDVSTTFLGDPPCLRVVSFKVVENKLQMSVFFRSWDLFAGFPENFGGLQLLKEDVLSHLLSAGLIVEDGPIIGYSDGLHIYEQYFDLVDGMNVEKVYVDKDIIADKEQFATQIGEE